jgi:hypothetical protein
VESVYERKKGKDGMLRRRISNQAKEGIRNV